MTPPTPELLDLAADVVGRAGRGEGLEVYVARGTDTEVRAYEGEVESLTSADSSGVGIRVLVDDPAGTRVGFAWAGSLDPDVIGATLADARDNARFATPDPDVVLASPDGVAAREIDLWDPAVATTPMEQKVALAIDLERATRAADPRVRQVSSADYSDSRAEVALASTTGISSYRRRTQPSSPWTPSRGKPRRPRPAPASPSVAVRVISSPRKPWTTRCSAPCACSGPRRRARRTARSCSTPVSCRRCSV